MGPKHSREQILLAATELAASDGLGAISFGRVAARMGINDRMVVYYFPTKDHLVTAVLEQIALDLQAVLSDVVTDPADGPVTLARALWPALGRASSDRSFALFFEASGLCVAGREPYVTVVPALVELFVAWASDHLDGPPDDRRAGAEATIALVDGLLLLRQVLGPEAADRAAASLSLAPS